MNVIFLDIDGVLNSNNPPDTNIYGIEIEKKFVKRILYLKKKTNSKICLISDWRISNIKEEIESALNIELDFIINKNLEKEPGIIQFLEENKVSKYIIIDDDILIQNETLLEKHLKTIISLGFTRDNLIKAFSFFKKKTKVN